VAELALPAEEAKQALPLQGRLTGSPNILGQQELPKIASISGTILGGIEKVILYLKSRRENRRQKL